MVSPAAVWFIDSGCGHHMTWNPALFQNLTSIPFSPNFQAVNGSPLKATHIGDIGSFSNKLFIPNTFLVPDLKCNLLSVGQLSNYGASFIFSSSGCIIEDSTGHVVGRGRKVGNHFILDELHMFPPQGMGRRLQMAMASKTNPSSKRTQRNVANSDSISRQLVTASSEANNRRRLNRSTTEIKNIVIQPLKVPQMETTLRWIESELMDDRVEISDDDSFLIDLEVYKHNLWSLGYQHNL